MQQYVVGLPGVGKSHALSAVGHALVEAGHSVLCAPAYALVQELLGAKRDLDLPRALRKLDLFEVILLDDLGYVQQSPDEAEVLFTLLAERYERRSVMVTSNLVFSQWDRIFPRPDGHGRSDRPPGTPRGRDRIRRPELSNGPVAPQITAGACPPRPVLPVRCCPGPADGRPRERLADPGCRISFPRSVT